MSNATKWKSLALRIRAMSVLRALRGSQVMVLLLDVLDNLEKSADIKVDAYAAFVSTLYDHGGNLGDVLLELVQSSTTAVDLVCAAGKPLPKQLLSALQEELQTLRRLSTLDPQELANAVENFVVLPLFANTERDFEAVYKERLENIGTCGYGDFARWHMFTLGADGQLLPVKNPDKQSLAGLHGYKLEREKVVTNTLGLMAGVASNNILLYGDAGTGKSSTVKAIVNEYKDEGLRLVEVQKNQMYALPRLMEALAVNPLKFIIFIDDLSFSSQEGDFAALKAILEGNVSALPANVVVYATSNRRHMLRQLHSSRQGDELHLNDTLEEEASLAARFGLCVTFSKPDRDLYAEIAHVLAKKAGLPITEKELTRRAEGYAIRSGGRSPRAAKQFVDYLKAEQALQTSGKSAKGAKKAEEQKV